MPQSSFNILMVLKALRIKSKCLKTFYQAFPDQPLPPSLASSLQTILQSDPNSSHVLLFKHAMLLLSSGTLHMPFFLVGTHFANSWPNWLLFIFQVCPSRYQFLWEILSAPPTMPSFCPVRVLTMMDFKSLSQSPGYFSLDKGCLIYHHVSCAQHILRHTVELSSTCYLNKAEPLKLCVAPGHPQSRPRGETEIPQREYSLRR